VVVETNANWYKSGGMITGHLCLKMDEVCEHDVYVCPAPTFEELWAVMPDEITDSDNDCYYLNMEKVHRKLDVTRCMYANEIIDHIIEQFSHESPTEAAGMLLVWLAENGHLEGK